ncbi:MAG TPA: hypothetical protein VJ835_04090 [Fimbriimonadaceae bacterium]|nr:hypothetical protein [Fimbriimonadaceae bacterium]
MEDRSKVKRLTFILVAGTLVCGAALGFRLAYKKTIHGTWMGYSYLHMGGKMVPDEAFGTYLIKFDHDGTYVENGNSTSGVWKQTGNKIQLTPIYFMNKTPDEHRAYYIKKAGKVSRIFEKLIKDKMKPMTVVYSESTDRIIYEEPTLHYEYKRL